MKGVIHRPSAAAIVNSLRAIGYSFNTAIADIIDNSIAAAADDIEIYMRTSPRPYVGILDNGRGMSEVTLLEAMRHGGQGPDQARSSEDLGRYGLGLKTASLSQCRRLTVVTLANGELTAARWDLDQIELQNEWILQLIPRGELAQLPRVAELERNGHGTIVLWEDFDRALAGEASPGPALERLVDGSRDHLALVFHRFLSPDDGSKPLCIRVNGLALEPVDPFLTSNKRTEKLPRETIAIDGEKVVIQAYILPHVSNLSESEVQHEGGREGLKQSQGFYVYRNRRLITAGTWFRMIPQDQLTKLARVRIDIPNSLDHLWNLDVKKSTATPPEEMRTALKRIIHRIADRSQNVFRDRRRRRTVDTVERLWERRGVRGGAIYEINREHRSVSQVREALEPSDWTTLERLLKMLEVGLPADSIYVDMASDRSLERPAEEVYEELKRQVDLWLSDIGTEGLLRENLLTAIPQLEPFSMYPAITKKLIEEIRNAQQ